MRSELLKCHPLLKEGVILNSNTIAIRITENVCQP